MSQNPSFGKLQQAFALSFWSNKVASLSNASSPVLAQNLSDAVAAAVSQYQQYVGNWSIVWGPAVYCAGAENNNLKGNTPSGNSQNGSGMADNAIYVAYNGTDTYVVAIAATNPQSKYDWMQEDFGTDSVVPFAPASSATPDPSLDGAHISAGTALGVEILQNLMPQGTLPQANTTLQEFLATVQDSSKTLIFAGHSLGGALSPTLTISQYPSKGAQAVWGAVHVVPTAGATPGDTTFSTGFKTVFPQVEDTTAPPHTPNLFNTDLWNQYDVVPHAWDYLQGSSFPQYVAPPRPKLPLAQCIFGTLVGTVAYSVPYLVQYASDHAAKAGVTYTALSNEVLPGTAPDQKILDIETFLGILAQEHIGAYYSLMGVTPIQDPNHTSFWEKALIAMWEKYIIPFLPPFPPPPAQ